MEASTGCSWYRLTPQCVGNQPTSLEIASSAPRQIRNIFPGANFRSRTLQFAFSVRPGTSCVRKAFISSASLLAEPSSATCGLLAALRSSQLPQFLYTRPQSGHSVSARFPGRSHPRRRQHSANCGRNPTAPASSTIFRSLIKTALQEFFLGAVFQLPAVLVLVPAPILRQRTGGESARKVKPDDPFRGRAPAGIMPLFGRKIDFP